MKKYRILCAMIAALSLGGCGSAGSAGNSLSNALTNALTPKPHGGRATLSTVGSHNEIMQSGGNSGDTITVTDDNGHSVTYDTGRNSAADISSLWRNKQSDFRYVLKSRGNDLEKGTLSIYNRAHSTVVGAWVKSRHHPADGALINQPNIFKIKSIQGDVTPVAQLPTSGIVRYHGHGFTRLDERHANGTPRGVLDYTVDFRNRTGSGSITGLRTFGNIDLQQGRLSPGSGINGNAVSQSKGSGHYELNFYGPNAAEIAGKAHGFNGFGSREADEVGFAGEKVETR